MTVHQHEKFGIYGLSDIKKQKKNGFIYTTFLIHFTPNVDRYSIYFYQIIREDWVQADVKHRTIKKGKQKIAQRSVGRSDGFHSTEDVAVKILIIAYYPTSQFEAVTKQFSHVFE